MKPEFGDRGLAVLVRVGHEHLARLAGAQVWAYQHLDSYSKTLAAIIGFPEEAARLQFERRATRWLPIDAQVVADQQRTADFYLKVGLVKQKLDVSKTFDSQFSQLA